MMYCRHWTKWRIIGVGAAIYATSLATVVMAEDSGARHAVLSASDVRAGIARAQTRITAFRITYEIRYPFNEGWPAGTYLRRVVAAMSPYSFFHETAHGHDALSWHDDPRLRRCYVVGDHAIDEWVNDRSYNYTSLKSGGELPGSMPGEFLIHATGLWPLSGRLAPQYEEGPIVLREIAGDERYNFIRPMQEQCDGHWCHVLEFAGRDCLWIDTQRGFALMARETKNRKTGYLIQRIELGGHREIKPGIWLPTWIRNTQFDFTAKAAGSRKRKVIESTLELLMVQVNEDVAADMFQFVPPAGALWLNPPDRNPIQTSPGGEEHLDNLVLWAQKFAPGEKLEASTGAKILPFGCALIAFLAWETFLQVLRWRSKHPSVSSNPRTADA